MIVLIVSLLISVGISGYIISNLLRKVETLEEKYEENQIYINSISKNIGESNEKLKELDAKGVFKGDDEIGWFFKNILYIQEILNQYNLNEKTKSTPTNNSPVNYDYIPFDPNFGKEEKEAKNY